MPALINAFTKAIIDPLIAILYGVGILFFIVGVVEFFFGLNRDDPYAKEAGKKHMLYGIVGLVVMFAAQGIIALIANTINSVTH